MMTTMMNRMNAAFDAEFSPPSQRVLDAELERQAYAFFCSNFPAGILPPTFEEWRERSRARGNAEGHNHD